MIIKDMFAKPINRDIKGVIKVGQDDEANIKQELEEYVVTRELQRHFADFYSSYKKGIQGNTDKMGVWISGFFGSGKSHFLKILSYLIENKIVDGKAAIDYFIDDNKISDPMVVADMKLAASVPTDVIAFNIDSKSEVNGKQSKDAIVTVLQNAFNSMQGFSGSNPFLADLERKLSEDNKYEEFKETFEENYGSSWEESRSDFDFIQDDVVEALYEIDFMSEEAARNWCEKTTGEYIYKVEDFARLVKKYIDSKGKNHHVVFLVDEMGQYIGEDSKLMLNLQTVTEDLGTYCKGKVWIIVTSQQDIDSITKVKGNDFSKIQGRFDTRLSLSSANVDEVIKKRILEKNETGKQTLSLLYEGKATDIKNIIMFDDGIEKKLYSDSKNFAEIYPFIPYQFNLLGDVLTSIRIHSSSGKHIADGERSMLALFKESAVEVMNNEPGTIVPFNMFYDALEKFLDHSHRVVIERALKNEYINPDKQKDCFDVNVLKVLFMIKYVKEIKANVYNITSLMVTNIDEDRMALTEKVEAALKRLVKQTLVQKNNDEYLFLTDEEQEIGRMIEAQNVDIAEVNQKVSELIFEDLYTEKKYRYPKFNGRYVFGFNQVVDDKQYKSTQNYDITLKILTPDSDERLDETALRILSGKNNCVLVVMPEDRAFIDEIRSYLKIEKFLRIDTASSVARYTEIKEAKRKDMVDKLSTAKLFLSESLKNSDIYVNSDRVQISSTEITSRFNDAMGKLITNVYHKLPYITTPMNESDILSILKYDSKQLVIDGDKIIKNEHALDDVREYIDINTNIKHISTSMKTLLDRFTKAPYGFIDSDVHWLVAKLFKDGEIALFLNGDVVSLFLETEEKIARYIIKREYSEKLMVKTKQKVEPKKKKMARDIAKELFKITLQSEDDDLIMRDFLKRADNFKQELEKLEIQYHTNYRYPGKNVVNDGKKLIIDILQAKYSAEFFDEVWNRRDELLDLVEDYEPVKKFFEGEQKKIFDNALRLMKIYEDSKTFIVDDDIENTARDINTIIKKTNPYSDIHKLPELLKKFTELNCDLLTEKQKPVDEAIDEAQKNVFEWIRGKSYEDRLRPRFTEKFSELRAKTAHCDNIAKLKSIESEVEALKSRCFNETNDEERKLVRAEPNTHNDPLAPPEIAVRSNLIYPLRDVIDESRWSIRSEEDIDVYVKELEKKLKSRFKKLQELEGNINLTISL